MDTDGTDDTDKSCIGFAVLTPTEEFIKVARAVIVEIKYFLCESSSLMKEINMAKCAYCNSTILFGGKKHGEFRFCNDECYQQGALLLVANKIPEEIIQREAYEIHLGRCPKCRGPGPVDVHTSYRVWSAVVLTSWSSRPQVCCRSCGLKSKLGDSLFSLLLGWWGIPYGVIFTPVQVGRNIIGVFSTVDALKPSPQLETMVRLHLANQLVKLNQPPSRS